MAALRALSLAARSRPAGALFAPRSFAAPQRRFFAAAAAAEEHDIVVIGGGPGGYVAAIKAGQMGKKVACIEKRGTLGGTCLNVGCIPSKALLHASHLYELTKKYMPDHGIDVQASVNVATMMKAKEKAVRSLTAGIEGLFKKNKVAYLKGTGRITKPTEVVVDGMDGTTQTLKTKNIIIATGSEVMSLPNIKIDEKRIISSTGALSLQQVPKHMIVIGGGVIGLELGSVWRRLGAQVTVVEFLDRIAAGADLEITKSFQKTLEKQGMQFKLATKVLSATDNGSGVRVVTEPAAGGKKEELDGDIVLVSIGRRPFTDRLGLKEVGVALDDRGRVKVDAMLRTTVPNIWAIGDVVTGPMLAHKAEEEGIACVERIVTGHGEVNYDAIPSVIYTHPEVAWVGKTEEQVKASGVGYKVGKFPMMANSRAKTNDETDGMVKVLADAKTDRILGVHMMSASAGELISEAVLGMEYGASSEDIARTCHAHPTVSEATKEACMATYDKAIHF